MYRRLALIALVTASLLVGSVALATNVWFADPPPEPNIESRFDMVVTEPPHQVSEPTGLGVTELRELVEATLTNPGVEVIDSAAGDGFASVTVGFDGERIEFVNSKLETPLALDAIGPVEEVTAGDLGGVSVARRKTEQMIQVVAVGSGGMMVNGIADRSRPNSPNATPMVTTVEELEAWVLTILKGSEAE